MELSYEERTDLTTVVIGTLDEWGLTPSEVIAVLGLPARTRPRELVRYRQGQPLPEDEAILESCRHILAIQHTLELIFPHNPGLSAAWATDPGNRYFGCAPVEVMLREGLMGIRRVRDLLECRSDWE